MTFLIIKLVATAQEGMEDLEMKIADGLCAWLCLTLCDPLDCSPPGSSVHGKNSGGGFHALHVIFLTQGLNLGLLHCRQILYLLSHQRSPGMKISRTQISSTYFREGRREGGKEGGRERIWNKKKKRNDRLTESFKGQVFGQFGGFQIPSIRKAPVPFPSNCHNTEPCGE